MSGPENHEWINTDVPLGYQDEDQLGRRAFADRVAQRIAAAGTGPSIVFGLAGPWGSGKSSTLNMIRGVVEKNFSTTWTVTELTPWSAADAATLMDEFYNCIAAAMPPSKKGQDAAKKLRAMAPVGVAVGKAIGRAIVDRYAGEGATGDIAEAAVDAAAESAGNYRVAEVPFITRFTRVSQAIKEAGHNFLVVVDDVDRLHVDELLTLFKAVRVLGRFDSVHYLLSYDEQTILDVLQASDIAHNDSARAAAYLEKIIQYPFQLPPIQDAQLARHLRARLTETARLHAATELYDSEDRHGDDAVALILQALPQEDRRVMTLRSVNRLTTQVDIMMTLAGQGELDFVDAALVTHLRMQHRRLYDWLSRSRNTVAGAHTWSFSPNSSEPNWKTLVAGQTKLPVDDPLVDQLVYLLSVLFPKVRQLVMSTFPASGCRIFESQYFNRYFTLTLPEGDIADATVRAEFRELCNSGILEPNSAIACALFGGSNSWSPVVSKVRDNLDAVAETSPQTALAVSIALGEGIHTGGPPSSGWLSIGARFLHRAITGSSTLQDAEQSIAQYRARFGLVATTHALAVARSLPEAETVVSASRQIRTEVLEACIRDLTTDLDNDAPSESRTVDLLHYLDDDMWTELRDRVTAEVSENYVAPYELAGRFVRPAEQGLGSGFLAFWFERLIPVALWEVDGMPDVSPDDESLDGSGQLEHRIRYAVREMRHMTNAAQE
ncbi:MAG: KAP family NTPase [Mycobacteriaceae bacterium]|jgi:hypothetical protein|nr:KAP family NTPase [Mycobacteriaceae bacterium]